MKDRIRSAWALVQENRKAYLVINAVYYGLVIIFMIYAAFNQPLQEMLLKQVGAAFMRGPLSFVGEAYNNARVLPAIASTFLVNLFVGSFVDITLPSLLMPFSGLLIGGVRAVLWGLILSPANPALRLAMIPHSVTLLLEGQGYILALLAAWIQGRAFLQPWTVGAGGLGRGYFEGIKRTATLYILVILVLAAAAVYEVIEVVLIAKIAS
jgi:hypothetical protein